VGSRRRIQRGRPLALVLLLGLGPYGCTTAPKLPLAAPIAPLRAATLEEVLAAYDGFCNGIETLSASGDLDVHDGRTGRSRKLSVRLVATRGGRLYLKGSVAIVTALEVVSDGERFWFVVPSKKTVWTGRAGQLPHEAAEGASLSALRPKDLTWALIPEALTRGAGDTLILEGDRQTFSLTLARVVQGTGVVRRRVWLDRESLRPVRSRTYGENGDVVTEATFGQWSDGKPHSLSVSRPAEAYEVDFAFSKVEYNVKAPERAFAPRTPEGYKLEEIPD
jgi:outer membrane lipoprotein-sorting protein